MESTQFGIIPPGGLSPPKGLNAAMEGLVREVLRKNPKDIFTFAAEYFETLIEIRKKSNLGTETDVSNYINMYQNFQENIIDESTFLYPKKIDENIITNHASPPVISGSPMNVENIEDGEKEIQQIGLDIEENANEIDNIEEKSESIMNKVEESKQSLEKEDIVEENNENTAAFLESRIETNNIDSSEGISVNNEENLIENVLTENNVESNTENEISNENEQNFCENQTVDSGENLPETFESEQIILNETLISPDSNENESMVGNEDIVKDENISTDLENKDINNEVTEHIDEENKKEIIENE